MSRDAQSAFSAVPATSPDRKIAEQKLQTQLERLNLLGQITRAIGERQDLRSIFQVVIRSLEDSLPIDFGCVCLYDAHAEEVVVTCVGVRSEALAMELAMTDQAHISIDQNGLSHCVARPAGLRTGRQPDRLPLSAAPGARRIAGVRRGAAAV